MGSHAVESILADGIRCDEETCACGRYGKGGYVAVSAIKANAYADASYEGNEDPLRRMFLVLALPDRKIVQGVRGERPIRTAADLPSNPTEYCFVDAARLHCTCMISYRWISTGRREKYATAGARISHIVPSRGTSSCRERSASHDTSLTSRGGSRT